MAKIQLFPVLIILGRPASGKSEIIDFLQHYSPVGRLEKYYIGKMDVIDDFPMLWTWFEEDAILSKQLGKPRLYTDAQGDFKHKYLWDLLVERIGLEYHKRKRDDPAHHERSTTIIEFSRGQEHGGYHRAFQHLPKELLDRAAIIYVRVSYAESLRKNRLRYNPQRPDSILEHSLPDEKLERLYRHDDWEQLTNADSGYLMIQDMNIPYAVFENEDDVTTSTPDQMAARLKSVIDNLWLLSHD